MSAEERRMTTPGCEEGVEEEKEEESFIKDVEVMQDSEEDDEDGNNEERKKDVAGGAQGEEVNEEDGLEGSLGKEMKKFLAEGKEDGDESNVIYNRHDDIDINDNDSDDNESKEDRSLLYRHSATSLSNEYSTLRWKTFDSELVFSVKYIHSSPEDSVSYLNRFNESAYEEACEKEFVLMMFPPDNSVLRYFPHLVASHEVLGKAIEIKTDVPFRMEFLYINHLIKAIRLRKILLLQEYKALKGRIHNLKEFLVLCDKKMDAQKRRLGVLENELVLFEPYNGFSPNNIFASFLCSSMGWMAFQSLFDKELRYLQNLCKEKFKANEKKLKDAAIAEKQSANAKKKLAAQGVLEDGSSDISSLDSKSAPLEAKEKREDHDPDHEITAATEDVQGGEENEEEVDTDSMFIEKTLNRQGLGLSRDQMEIIWTHLRYWQVLVSVAIRAHLNSDAAYRTYSTSSRRRIKSPSSKKRSAVEAYVEEVCPEFTPLLPGGVSGVAEWSEICEFLGVDCPSSYRTDNEQVGGTSGRFVSNETKKEEFNSLMHASKVLLDLLTCHNESSPENHHSFQNVVLSCVSKVSISNLTYVVHEEDVYAPSDTAAANEDDFNSTISTVKLGKCLLAVADDIAQAMEDLLVENFRRLKIWSDVLDSMRKERVKKEGGQIMLRDNQEVEIDEQGAIRVIPNADDIIDTDVLHKSKQRVRVAIAIPQANRELKSCKARKYSVQGELAAVTQLGFTTIAPYCQRVIRGSLVRKRVHRYLRSNCVLLAMHAAAVVIQAKVRQLIAKRLYVQRVHQRRMEAVRLLQSRLRGMIARKLVAALQQERRKNLIYMGAVSMQRIIRGFLGRRVVKRLLARAQDEKDKANHAWASLTIQKYARRYIAKHSIVRSRHIRNNLSPQVLLLAERYMTKTNGDLWGFLKEIDDTMKRLSQTIEENQSREDNWANTFVDRVLKKRQDDFDASWTEFADQQSNKKLANSFRGGSVSSKKTSTVTPAVTSNSLVTDWDASANMSILDTPSVDDGSQEDHEPSIPNPPPGAFMRRVVSSTMKKGERVRAAALKASTARADANKARVESIKDAYAPQRSRAGGSKRTNPKVGQVRRQGKQRKALLTSSKFQTEEKTASNLSTAFTQDDWITQGAEQKRSLSPLSTPKVGSPYKGVITSPDTLHKPAKHHPGYTLLVDIPHGLKDKMERLIQAAAMRCYVPDLFWKGETGEPQISHQQAYQMYLDLPENSLAKLRYEQKVHQWCAGVVNRLRLKGFVFIHETLPVSKMGMFLRSVDCPRVLLQKTLDLAYDLQAMQSVPDGLLHKGFKEGLDLIKEGKGTVKTALQASGALRSDDLSSTKDQPSAPSGELTDLDEPFDRPSTSSARVTGGEEKIKAKAQALLEHMVSKGAWTDLNAPVDTIVQHAAFLVCPHKDYDELVASGTLSRGRMEGVFESDDEETMDEKRMGHLAFHSFAREMMQAKTELDSKICIRDRYRAAVILSTPFELQLQDLKVYSVRDLVTLTSDGVKGSPSVAKVLKSMPKPFQLQLEALLSMVVSIEQQSNLYPGAGESKVGSVLRTTAITKDPTPQPAQMVGPLIDNPRLIQAPLVFDSKFQRGPFDPYGRPARLPGQLPCLVQHSAATRKFRLYGNSGSVMNEIGGDRAVAISLKERSRRQQAEKDLLSASGQFVHADTEEMHKALPPSIFEMSRSSQKEVERELEGSGELSNKLLADDTFQSLKRDDDITTHMWSFEPDKRLLKNPARTDNPLPASAGLVSRSSSTDEPHAATSQLKPTSSSGASASASSGTGMKKKSSDRERAKKSGVHMTWFGETFDTEHHFDRPHRCKFDGCEQAFTRLYSLRLHEKSHLMFPDYHKFKRDPMLGFDADRKQMEEETRRRLLSLENLPLLREKELEKSLLSSSFDGHDSSGVSLQQGVSQSKPSSVQSTSRKGFALSRYA